MGNFCTCFISNPNELITLDYEIEKEKRRAFKHSPISLEDHTNDYKATPVKNKDSFSNVLDQSELDQAKESHQKNNSFDSEAQKKEMVAIGLLAEFNEARTNPSQYSNKVVKYANYIKTSNKGECYFEFNKQKILLDQGSQVFEDCIEHLKGREPIKKLQLAHDLVIHLPYDQIHECDKNNVINKALSLKKTELSGKYSKLEFQMHKSINNIELSALMQILDPNDESQSNRKNILNERLSHVGINCFSIDDNVVCFYILFGQIIKD